MGYVIKQNKTKSSIMNTQREEDFPITTLLYFWEVENNMNINIIIPNYNFLAFLSCMYLPNLSATSTV